MNIKKTLLTLVVTLFASTFLFAATSVKVKITTNYGVIVVKLYNETPLHKANFIKMVNNHSYDSLLFHRIIKGFMIQGGDPQSKYAKKGQALGNGEMPLVGRIPAELNKELIHKKGVLAAARDNNPQKASSNCQFYIVQGRIYSDGELDQLDNQHGYKYTPSQRQLYKTIGGTPHLDMGYTVYGEVVEGIEILDKIANAPTGPNDRPTEDIRILTMKILKKRFWLF
jgi:peptidyl-prolyl cis-trans isomerase B (cyclophilin B)